LSLEKSSPAKRTFESKLTVRKQDFKLFFRGVPNFSMAPLDIFYISFYRDMFKILPNEIQNIPKSGTFKPELKPENREKIKKLEKMEINNLVIIARGMLL
jgi:hypothetical protein